MTNQEAMEMLKYRISTATDICGKGKDGKAYITLAADEHVFPYRSPIPEYDLDPTDWCTNMTDAQVDEIGNTLFFTREEAEAKLAELRGSNE